MTYAIYSETCIIVLGQLLIRLLILIKQSLPKRKHHLFYHWADGINGCSVWTQKKRESKCGNTLILSTLMQFGKQSLAKYHWIKFQIKLSTQQFIGFFHTKSHYKTIVIKAFCFFLEPISSRIKKKKKDWKETHENVKQIVYSGMPKFLFTSCVWNLCLFISQCEYHDHYNILPMLQQGARADSQDMYGFTTQYNCYIIRLSTSSHGSRNIYGMPHMWIHMVGRVITGGFLKDYNREDSL